jgi:2-iminobutanoate/2-iminopropanoate deaminase
MGKQTYHFGGSFSDLPYSHVVRAGDLLFVSGTVAWDDAANAPVAGGIEAQTTVVLEKIKGMLESAGSSLDKVVKATVFLTERGDFPAMNRVYKTYFPEQPPARATVGVTLMQPGLLIEMEAIALAE